MPPLRRKLLLAAAVLVVLAAILFATALLYTEYLWFSELGFTVVLLRRIFVQVSTGAALTVLALLVLGVHLRLARKRPGLAPVRDGGNGSAGSPAAELLKRAPLRALAVVAVLLALVFGYLGSRHWEEVLKVLHWTRFGESDPVLGQDVGFYLFVLPLMEAAQSWLLYLTAASAILVLLVYALREEIVVKGRVPEMSARVRAHLLVALASVLVPVAWDWRLEMFKTLSSTRGLIYGATFTDVHVRLVVCRVMIAACLVCALALVYLAWRRSAGPRANRRPIYVLGGLLALYLVGYFGAPVLVQQFVVTPNELDRERPYLAHAIAGSRRAYGLDRIEAREFPAHENLTSSDLRENRATVENIKIWDPRPLRATYKQLQAIRLYYDFPSMTVDRYRVGNTTWQVMLAARELLVDLLPEESRTWVNRHLQYTHGYGLGLSPVKRVSGEGLPDLWVKDLPPESRFPQLKITRPEIYFGQGTRDYALVRTSTKEFDYPRGSENEYTTYQGDAGVGIGSLLRRLLFAIRFQDLNLLFTSYLTPESRILFARTIQDRVGRLAPFLALDQEPYMVVADGRLYWVQDAYAVSDRYPYSQPIPLGRRGRINYVRNSVKVVVDAYHGTVRFYLWDERDPVARTYGKMFPGLFSTAREMPRPLRGHVRYPTDLFSVQAAMFEVFHMTDPRIFYNQEDKWRVAGELTEKAAGRREQQAEQAPPAATKVRRMTHADRMDPSYMIMRLPGESKEEFQLMVPFTPTNRDNLVAWLTARSDGEDYGKLLVYTFPKQKLVYGPMQIEARINQDEHISQWITLRNQQGTMVLRGDLLVIPIKESILYIEPIFLQSRQTQIPELKQVIAAFGNRLAMKETLGEALSAIGLGGAEEVADSDQPTTRPGVVSESSVADALKLVRRALQHYRATYERAGRGDWEGAGEEQLALSKLLDEIGRRLGAPAGTK